ncbi:hypothetical protein M405DRAFT_390911 [Rhizopogon salebrosus TDB-379]|nr:hypothetical protein M405DRAFT_390911 [Rhizopogon salebrosus TDB-379]
MIVIDLSSILQHGLSVKSCTAYFAFNSYIGAILLYCAESLFMLRVWAMSSHQHWRWIVTLCNFVCVAFPGPGWSYIDVLQFFLYNRLFPKLRAATTAKRIMWSS